MQVKIFPKRLTQGRILLMGSPWKQMVDCFILWNISQCCQFVIFYICIITFSIFWWLFLSSLKPLTWQGRFKGKLEPIRLYVKDTNECFALFSSHKIHFQVCIRDNKIFNEAVFLVNGHLIRSGHLLPCNQMDGICLSVVALVLGDPDTLHYNFSNTLGPRKYQDGWHRLDFQRSSGVLYMFYRSVVK